MTDVPVLTVCSIDPVLRDTAAAALLVDLPDAVVVRHDITPDGLLHRTVYDWTGVRDRCSQPLDHGCMSCALRADLLPVLRALIEGPADDLAGRPRPGAVVVALPVGAESRTLVQALAPDGGAMVRGARPAAVLTAIEPGTLLVDLFGDDLLAERRLALGPDDRRSVGEALAAQLEFCDAVLAPAGLDRQGAAVLGHLTGAPSGQLHEIDTGSLLATHRTATDPRGDMLTARPTGEPDGEFAWTLHLYSPRPFHPDRLHESIEALGTGRIRGRGVFWLPGRPGTIGVWDGAGGQLSIGAGGRWVTGRRHTRLVVTGIGPERDVVETAFWRALASEAELGRGPAWWSAQDDGFDPWLGHAGGMDEDLSA